MKACARNTTRSWALSLTSGSHMFTSHTPLESLRPAVEWDDALGIAFYTPHSLELTMMLAVYTPCERGAARSWRDRVGHHLAEA